MAWQSMTREDIRDVVTKALNNNLSYTTGRVLGYPASTLDREVFPRKSFLNDKPLLSCFVENPNHIGCHTLDKSELPFAGTQEIERDLIQLCARDILGSQEDVDGYVASGGTESNIQAMWIYRNYFQREHGALAREVALIHSEDSHYSMPKGANLLGLSSVLLPVNPCSRKIDEDAMSRALLEAIGRGIKYCIVVLNMGTTMFGSVDDPHPVHNLLDRLNLVHKTHVDAAFGGFIYPMVCPENPLSFQNPRIESFTIDAHKMLQAPYGTGIFLIRKGLMEYVQTAQAEYVHGKDYTLCGSRSGTNAIATWMILQTYGRAGAEEFLSEVLRRTDRICEALNRMGIEYFREPRMNVIAIRATGFPQHVAEQYHLVPDTHDREPTWWKIVVMDHVSDSDIDYYLSDLASAYLRKPEDASLSQHCSSVVS